MSSTRTRLTRLAAASTLALGLGALGAGSAMASYSSWAGSAPVESTVTATGEDGLDGIGKPGGVRSVGDGQQAPNAGSTWSG